MSRLPSAAASRSMSACSVHAMSHVGCRLIVASSANTSLPRAPARCGDIARAFATNAAMSFALDVGTSGASTGRTSLPDVGLIVLPAISACLVQQTLCGPRYRIGQRDEQPARMRFRAARSVGGRRNLLGLGQRERLLELLAEE